MAALPYIQLYVADYLADTIHLTAEEHGAYLLIIMNYWQTGKPVPKNRLQAITGINGHWADVETTLKEFFIEDENGNWLHERIEQDLKKVKSKSIKCSNAGKASARSKVLKTKEKSTGVQQQNQQAFNHTDTDTYTDTEKNTSSPAVSDPVPFAKIIDLYHEKLPMLPKVEKLTNTRKGYLRQRWVEDLKTLEEWGNYFEYVSRSKFLTGRVNGNGGKPPFRASLEWLTKPGNYAKVAEENYHGKVQ